MHLVMRPCVLCGKPLWSNAQEREPKCVSDCGPPLAEQSEGDKPVTQEWLEKVSGGRWKHGFGGEFVTFKASFCLKGDGVGVELGKRTGYLRYLTRGQFRGVCSVLSIDLLPAEQPRERKDGE